MSFMERKHHRVELGYGARILSLAAEHVCDCALLDVSQGGARLAVLASEMVPDEFLLMLSTGNAVGRRCKVEWRKENEVGLSFVKVVDAEQAMKAHRRARLLETPCP